jgi:Deoxyribonuclease NucA/NucB
MRRGARAALLSIAVVVLGGVLTSQASAADDAPRTQAKAYVVSGPQYFNSEGRLKTDKLRSQATLERLAAKARGDGGVKPMTANAARRAAVAQNAEYGTPSANVARAPDDITVEECRDRYELSGRSQGWIKNHFSYCQLGAVVAVEQRCWWRFCQTIGFFGARVTLMGYAYNGLRNVDWTAHIDQVTAYGTAAAGAFTYEIDCAGSPNDDSCLPGGHEVTRTVAQWRADGEADLLFFSDAEPSSPAQGEQIDTGVFQVEGEFRFPSGTARAANGPETSVRFDSAWYLPQQQGSIFDRVTPWIGYSVNDPAVNQSAHHIRDAQRQPGSTYPRVAGKQIPGASAENPLHRLYHDTTRRRQNREGFAVPVCEQQWPGYPELSQDCDEYPFASTYEGAARHLYEDVPYGWFSVRPILFSDNQTAGSRLGTWYGADRILDGDAYYVRITG